MPSRKNKVQSLTDRIKTMETEVYKLRLQNKELKTSLLILVENTKKMSQLFRSLQPIIGKLIGGYIVLDKKGLVSNELINSITQEEADSFVAKAHPEFAQQVQNQSNSARPVENNPGDGGTGVSGTEGVREPVPDPKADEQPAAGTVNDGLQGVRAPDGGDDKSSPTGEVAPPDRPAGS